MKILRAEKVQPRKRTKAPTNLRRTDWDVLMQHDRFSGKLDLKSKELIKDPGSVKRLLEAEMIYPDGNLTPEAREKCAGLARKLQTPAAAGSVPPVLPGGEIAQQPAGKQTVKLTASDWAVLVKYDRKTGNLLKYDPKTNELDNTSRAILKDPSIIQRLIDNNMILPGGWLTPEAKKECVRIEQKLKARAADGYSGPKDHLDPERESNGERQSKDVREQIEDPKKDKPGAEAKSEVSPKHPPGELTGQNMQTFFEKISYEDPDPERQSNGEPLSKGERLSKGKPQSAPVAAQTKQNEQQQNPIEDSASAETMNNIDWASISRSERKSQEKRRRRGRGPDSTDGDIPGPPAISMRDIFHVVFRRRAQIVLFFAAVFTTVVIGTLLAKPTYEASAQLLVKLGRESVFIPATGKSGAVINTDREERINSEIEILRSRALAGKVVAQMGPTALYPDLKDDNPGLLDRLFPNAGEDVSVDEKMALRFETAVETFQKALEVEGIKKSNVVQISFKHENSQMAALVVNKLADTYLDHHVSVHKAPKSAKFFQDQSLLLKTKMERSEEELKALKKQYHVTSLAEERTLLLKQSAALRAGLNTTLSLKVEAEKRIAQLSRQLAATPKTVSLGEVSDQNPYLINTLEARLVEY